MKKIGIIGGLSPESTVTYYKKIIDLWRLYTGNQYYPEIIIYSVNFQNFINNNYKCVEKVVKVINNMSSMGVDLVISACNSIHIIYDEVKPLINIPWINIAHCAAEQAVKNGMSKMGLLGTKFTIDSEFYKTIFQSYNINICLPNLGQIKKINNIIYEDLVFGNVKDSAIKDFLDISRSLIDRGCDGIILGCTELPYLVNNYNGHIYFLDTAECHCNKIVKIILDKNEQDKYYC